MTGRIIQGVERDRAVIRGAALKIIRVLESYPGMKIDSHVRGDWLAPPPLSAYRRLEPLGFGLKEDEEWWIFNPRDCTPDLVWPLDVGVCVEKGKTDDLHFSRTYTVSPKQVRGLVGRFGPFMIRMDVAQVDRGKLMRAAGIWVWLGGQWCNADKRRTWTKEGVYDSIYGEPEDDRIHGNLATALALRQRYEWAVALGLENSPSIRFATDCTGMKDIFRIRDLPEGRDRREALLTWVGDHWRQDRHDSEVERYVRSHLRGATSFNWRGMSCEVLPSQYDVEKRDALIAEREAMRAAGTDQRRRSS